MGDKSPAILQILSKIEGRQLIIDLTSTPNFDSCGIEFLCLVQQQFAGRNFHITLRNPNSHTREILQQAQLDQLFELE
ncbi:MAG: STAS domain-containing protein [Anaerolineales bacterium]|nr:STAS domain-containing protein [Anaerolineales bacterium]